MKKLNITTPSLIRPNRMTNGIMTLSIMPQNDALLSGAILSIILNVVAPRYFLPTHSNRTQDMLIPIASVLPWGKKSSSLNKLDRLSLERFFDSDDKHKY
jgi:hypothetical protein